MKLISTGSHQRNTNGVQQLKPFAKLFSDGGAATFGVLWSGNMGSFRGSPLLDLAGVKSARPAGFCAGTDLPVTSDVV